MAHRLVLYLVLAAFIAGGVLLFRAPPGERNGRTFDPDRLAELETEMWRAYYRRENAQLFRLLVISLREQFNYSWGKGTHAAYYLARAAMTFGETRTDYEEILPGLESAYTIARDWMGGRFDPRAVARAELAWWAARRERDPQKSSPEQVGRLIGELYALFYEVPYQRVAQAGLLRAQAGRLRDRGGEDADWTEVARLLRESYRALKAGVTVTTAAPPR